MLALKTVDSSQLRPALVRLPSDLELLCEGFSVFVRLWFAHTPSIPEDGKRAARASAESRYKQFVQHIVEHYSGGRRFLDDLPQERIADDAELAAAAEQTEEPRDPR